MQQEEMIYVGDGLRAPEQDELVGRKVTIGGRHGRVIKNGPLFMTVEWDDHRPEPSRLFVHARDCQSWLCRTIWWLFGR